MTGLDCDELVELVTSYLEGRLDRDTERRFNEHLAACDGCDRYLDQFRQTISVLGDDGRRRLAAVSWPFPRACCCWCNDPARS